MLLALGTGCHCAVAQEDRETKQTVAMSQQVYEKLTEIQELVEAKPTAQAQALTNELLSEIQPVTL